VPFSEAILVLAEVVRHAARRMHFDELLGQVGRNDRFPVTRCRGEPKGISLGVLIFMPLLELREV